MGMIARACARQGRGVPLGCADDSLRAHRAPSAVEHVRKDLVDLRLLEYPRSLPFDGLREAAHEARRVQRRAVRRVRRADGVRRVENRPRRFLSEQREVLLADTGRACFVDLGAGARELHFVAGDVDRPAFRKRAFDAFSRGNNPDLIHGRLHRLAQARRRVEPGRVRDARPGRGELPRAPSAVAARGAVAANLPLEDRHRQAGIGVVEVVRRPQSGVSASDDGNVDFEVVIERRARHNGL